MINSEDSVIHWKKFKALFENCFGFKFQSLEDVVDALDSAKILVAWHSLSDWENLDDLEIFHKLLGLQAVKGDVLVITEASYYNNYGPFQLHAKDLEQFVVNHLSQFGECFFNGDVAIICLNTKSIWAFHHEGYFAYIDRFNTDRDT